MVKSRLARVSDPAVPRRNLERDARFFRVPPDARFVEDGLRRPDSSVMGLLWASRGRPDRTRVIVYLHGGAFFCGSPRTHRHLAATLAGVAGARAVLPDYRLAPEHPFPAALDDGVLLWRHLLAQGYAPERMAFAGDSAGGGLAFALLLRLADEGLPQPGAVVGFSPWVDMTEEAGSLRRNARRDVMLPAHRFHDVVEFYLQGHDATDPLASPARGAFRHPPPALVLASRDEILADDAEMLADRLRAGGGDVELALWPRLPHAWPIFCGYLPQADAAVERAGRFIRRHLGAG